MRYKCACTYDGRLFFGWQRQPKHRSVQQVIEQGLSKVYQRPIQVHGASRTDTGVHAKGQVFHFDTPIEIPLDKLKTVINRQMDNDVRITDVVPVSQDFHSRYHTVSKTYEYRFSTHKDHDVFMAAYVYQYGRPADLKAMQAAAGLLLGTHDFRALMASGSQIENTVRTLYKISFENHGHEVVMRVTGSGFLYNMVRIMMGIFFDVSEGKKTLEGVKEALSKGDRAYFRRTAPACGLYLMDTRYEDQET